MGAKQPVCPRCGQKVKAADKNRHITTLIEYRQIAGVVVRHTTPCPKP